jgi:hypothetical protein
MFFRRPAHYVWARRMLAALTAAALLLHLLVPLAPPRMLPGVGLVDTGRLYGPAVYGPPQKDAMTNQYAAMPSLRVGWMVVMAIGLIVSTRGRWRWLWLAHPLITVAVVVGTANRYWLDGVVACALLALILLVLGHPPPGRRPPTMATDVRGNAHAGFGGRAAETHQGQPVRRCGPTQLTPDQKVGPDD